MRPEYSLFTFLYKIVLAFLARAIRQKKEIKLIQIRKEKVESLLFIDNIILYLKYPNLLRQKNLLEVINNFIELSGSISTFKNQ
jgi:hypothetical protein